MPSFETPVFSTPGRERLARHAHGGKIIIHATAEETGGALGMWETFTEPGKGPSPHVHLRETEVFRVISGRYRFWCGKTCFDGGPGTTVTLPPSVPHAWRNIGDTPGQMFGIVTPGGFERLFIEIERRGGCTHEEFIALQAALGVSDVELDLSLNPSGPAP
jgi:mannose-6-phosphate isomerase-like protein (cupin superfamily)